MTKRRQYRDLTDEQKVARRKSIAAWTKRNPETVRATKMYNRHGIRPNQYEKMLAEQGGKCAICKQPETNTIRGKVLRLAIDHDHYTNKNRALLCSRCNQVLGLVYDDDVLLEKMALYLRIHRMRGGDISEW